MHCRHHSTFHPNCAACHHVRSTHLEADESTRNSSFDWLSSYTSSLPSSVVDYGSSAASIGSSDFSGFDGGSSGGGGADGTY